MINGQKRVVMKKPKLDIKKKVDLAPLPVLQQDTPKDKLPKVTHKKQNGHKVIEKPMSKSTPKPDNQTILKTSSNKTIIATPDTEPSIDVQPKPSFDNQFLDKIEIKSKITKDTKTLEKLGKSAQKATKPQSRKKTILRKIVILIAALAMTVVSYISIMSYIRGEFTESLASFIFVIALVVLTTMLYTVLLIDFIVKDKVKK